MVRMLLYSGTDFILLVQERITFPSKITEQAPQTPVPQPIFVPVRPILRRTTASESFSGLYTTALSTPLIVKTFLESFISSPFHSILTGIGIHFHYKDKLIVMSIQT